jgi:hypothetical protein
MKALLKLLALLAILSAALSTSAQALTIPAGTTLVIRLSESVSSNDPVGHRFSSVLEYPLVVKGRVVAATGAKVYGRIDSSASAGRAVGRSVLALSLTDIRINGVIEPIYTTSYEQAGASSGLKTARRAGAGALIGAAIDGGRGAGRGAAIGAASTLLTPGQAVGVPRGTLLDFRLAQPLFL